LNRSAVELARAVRTAAYRALSPIERSWRAFRRESDLPPLWLRRHAGPVRAFESSARECRRQLAEWNALPLGGSILDLGCGPGAMALVLRDELEIPGQYLGIDVHVRSIAWCRRAFASDPRLRFELAEVASAYGPGAAPISDYRLPVADAWADLVIAKSLFTHLSPSESARYLGEIRRVLRPDGAALVTAFLFEGGEAAAFPHGDGKFRWRSAHRPASAAAYSKECFAEMIDDAGLWIATWSWGFFPGSAPRPRGQDVMLLRRKWLP
jgi:SAM-dependent methyltransferase